ncbi:hypothetical protein LPN01_14290 [Sphingomonas sp. A2-49]|uniref:hypothetical protein n=1 Tax=Sphingomonas sp. A2-49 TaxID=1391375 RepID=UPI0021CEE0B1|nr:hypothetical protein [Sphingomonas sp. A2-49]MCU6455251.1 hypothetical protein [Sphingomonas sp. A2-49]
MSRLKLGLFGAARSTDEQHVPKTDVRAAELKERLAGLTPVERAAFAGSVQPAG